MQTLTYRFPAREAATRRYTSVSWRREIWRSFSNRSQRVIPGQRRRPGAHQRQRFRHRLARRARAVLHPHTAGRPVGTQRLRRHPGRGQPSVASGVRGGSLMTELLAGQSWQELLARTASSNSTRWAARAPCWMPGQLGCWRGRSTASNRRGWSHRASHRKPTTALSSPEAPSTATPSSSPPSSRASWAAEQVKCPAPRSPRHCCWPRPTREQERPPPRSSCSRPVVSGYRKPIWASTPLPRSAPPYWICVRMLR